jgi:hypothetical protein
VSDTWTKADVVVAQWFWRRPLSAVMEALADHGFVIERIVEAQPSAEALTRFPDDLTQDGRSVVHRLSTAASQRRLSSERPALNIHKACPITVIRVCGGVEPVLRVSRPSRR